MELPFVAKRPIEHDQSPPRAENPYLIDGLIDGVISKKSRNETVGGMPPPSLPVIRTLRYDRLTVGDPKPHDLATLSEHDNSIFKEAWLDITYTNSSYKVKFAVICGTTYLKSVEPYCSYEFERIFNFESNCADFVQDKVVVVRPSSS
jgi:hypothetical protein